MSSKIVVVIDERHCTVKNQEELIKLQFGCDSFEEYVIPDKLWNYADLYEEVNRIKAKSPDHIVFISASPIIMMKLSYESGADSSAPKVWMMHANNKVSIEFRSGNKFVADRDSYVLLNIK